MGPPEMMTHPAPIFAPITPAVITHHPAPAMKPAARSSASTAHHRISSRRRSVAQPSTPIITAATTSDPIPLARAAAGPIGQEWNA